MKFRWFALALLLLPFGGVRAADTISVDFPDDKVTDLCRNLGELFEIPIVLPPDFVDFTKSIKLRDVTWTQILGYALDGSDYYHVATPRKGWILKKGDAARGRFPEFLPGNWGPVRPPEAAPIDELHRKFLEDGRYEVTFIPATTDGKRANRTVARGRWILHDDRLEITLSESPDADALASTDSRAAGTWTVNGFRGDALLLRDVTSGSTLLLRRTDL